MSDIILKILPDAPLFVPESELQLEAYELLKNLTGLNDTNISIVNLPEVEFQDAGGADMRIHCPKCSAELGGDWWSETVDKAWLSPVGFVNLDTITPCCSETVSLNDLLHDPIVGFSKFLYEVDNPPHIPSQDQIDRLQNVLGCKLRTIVARY